MKKFLLSLILSILILGAAVYLVGLNVVHFSEPYMLCKIEGDNFSVSEIYEGDHAVSPSDFDTAIVLGAGVRADGTPTPMLKDRLQLAAYLYNQGYVTTLFVTGDSSQENYDETSVMKAFLMDAGVPEEAIVVDKYGVSTYDSMYRAKYLYGVDKALVVTQTYHMYRAIYIARKLGIDAYGACSDQERYMGQINRDFREFLARDKDMLKVWAHPEADYMTIE